MQGCYRWRCGGVQRPSAIRPEAGRVLAVEVDPGRRSPRPAEPRRPLDARVFVARRCPARSLVGIEPREAAAAVRRARRPRHDALRGIGAIDQARDTSRRGRAGPGSGRADQPRLARAAARPSGGRRPTSACRRRTGAGSWPHANACVRVVTKRPTMLMQPDGPRSISCAPSTSALPDDGRRWAPCATLASSSLGLAQVRSLAASGNLVFESGDLRGWLDACWRCNLRAARPAHRLLCPHGESMRRDDTQ